MALHPLLKNIARAYTAAFDFALPLTAGADSRLRHIEVLLHHEKNPVQRFSCIHDSPLNWFCASAILRVSVPDKESQDFVLHIGQAQ
ncbi:MAG: hypothetical protein RSB18_10060 [Clostridia bacterium]